MSESAGPRYDVMAPFKSRRSIYTFDPDRSVPAHDLQGIFEAARWTMSASNLQPWRYVVADKSREPVLWQQVFDCLLPGNQRWAHNAAVLALGFAVTLNTETGKPVRTALHDLGAASAFLTVEAVSRGLAVHQMAGIDPQRVIETFAVEAHIEPVTAIAIGYQGTPEVVAEEYAKRELRPRTRLGFDQIILAGNLEP